MEGHATKCVERYSELAHKTIEQFFKVATPCMDDHQFREEENGSVGELSTVCSHTVLKCLYLACIGRPDTIWSVNKRLTRLISKALAFDSLCRCHCHLQCLDTQLDPVSVCGLSHYLLLACCLCLADRALTESGNFSDVWKVWCSSARYTIESRRGIVHWKLFIVGHDIHSQYFCVVFGGIS